MTEKRYEVAVYDDKAINGYCVLDKNQASFTARLGYKNVFISSQYGCEIVARLLNDKEHTINEMVKTIRIYDDGYIDLNKKYKKVVDENEKLKKEKEFWKGDSCNCSNYLSILSMDCQIVQEAISDLKNVIDVDTEAFRLLDELDDKFDELNQHRIKMYSR